MRALFWKLATKIAPEIDGYSPLIRKCYPDEPLAKLDQLKQAWLGRQDNPHADLGWLAFQPQYSGSALRRYGELAIRSSEEG